MKRLLVPVTLAAILSGCAVVAPYERPYSAYPSSTPYHHLDAYSDGYRVMQPAYHPPIYVGPPVRLSLRFQFWRGHGGHRWHHHGHGFRNHRFGGWRGGWRR